MAAQRDARLTRQKLAHMEIKLLETTNAKIRAETVFQRVQADAAVMRRSKKKERTDAFRSLEATDDLRAWLNKSDSSVSNWLS